MDLKNSVSRLDLEIYVLGDMKYEFLNFLEECYKQCLFESISWGNFKRYQLVISNENYWINIYFILVHESSFDILINSFKIFEKKNFTLLLYNANDQKSEKNIDILYDNLINERNKLYEGIAQEENLSKNFLKISQVKEENQKASSNIYEEVKNGLNSLSEEEDKLIYKVGFYPNQISKKNKNFKKTEQVTPSYDIDNEIFLTNEEENTNFQTFLALLLKEHFEMFKLDKLKEDKTFKKIVEIIKENSKGRAKSIGKKNTNSNFFRLFNWIILFYIVVCVYRYYFSPNEF